MSSLFEQDIMAQINSIVAMLKTMPLDDQVSILNAIRKRLHEASPFKDEPVDFVEWVPNTQVQGNDYNPNTVAPPEMRLLERSIKQDGFTQPIVGYPIEQAVNKTTFVRLHIEVVDGYHRHQVGKECKVVRERLHNYLPVTYIKPDRTDPKARISATIRHNRARGVHGVMPMTDIVAQLIQQGWTDTQVAQELGMDADEVLRFKQNCGLPELFKDHEYSDSWE